MFEMDKHVIVQNKHRQRTMPKHKGIMEILICCKLQESIVFRSLVD